MEGGDTHKVENSSDCDAVNIDGYSDPKAGKRSLIKESNKEAWRLKGREETFELSFDGFA